jgi:GntR family transcriptional regulator, transcriptional repressor for pyruvate dehydrogenase complex
MTVRFEPIDSTPGYKRVTKIIEDGIYAGRLAPGDSLPTEKELAEQLSVNRSTIREGIRALEHAGLVRRAGKQLVVCAPAMHMLAQHTTHAMGLHKVTFQELWEMLMTVEPMAARLAAQRRGDEAAARIAANVKLTEEHLFKDEKITELGVEFHALIAKATGNRALVIAEEPLSLLLHSATKKLYRRSPRARFRLLEAHRHIAEAIAARDHAQAEDWMRKHIEDFRRGHIVAGLDFKAPANADTRLIDRIVG